MRWHVRVIAAWFIVAEIFIGCATQARPQDAGAKPNISWVGIPMTKMLMEWQASLRKYPPIKMGTPDPYVPPK
jgi:hypothetical protein